MSLREDVRDPSHLICLGTRLVVLTVTGNDDSAEGPSAAEPEGLLALYRYKEPSKTGNPLVSLPRLLLEVGTNTKVYRSEVDWCQIRLPDEEKFKISGVLLQEGRQHVDITARLEHSKDSSTLDLIMQQKLPSGLQKYIYKTNLKVVTHKSSLLEYSHTLGFCLNESLQQRQSLQQSLDETQQKLDHWKATAMRLSTDVWQKEKDRLVSNFVKLWNEKQKREKQQFQELQEELERTKKQLELKSSDPPRKRGRYLKLEDEGAPDDLGQASEPIPRDEVEALAAGRRLPAHQAPQILKVEDTISAADLVQKSKTYEKKKLAEKKAKARARAQKTATKNEIANKDDDLEDSPDGWGKPKARATKTTMDSNNETTTRGADLSSKKAKGAKKSRKAILASLSSSGSETEEDEILPSPSKKRARPLVSESKEQEAKHSSLKVAAYSPKISGPDSDDERLRAQIRSRIRNSKHALSSSDEE